MKKGSKKRIRYNNIFLVLILVLLLLFGIYGIFNRDKELYMIDLTNMDISEVRDMFNK